MIKLFKKKTHRNIALRSYSITENTRIYCIGDIHGRNDLLIDLHDKISQDADGYLGNKIIIYLGDYIDRGLQSKAVIDRLINSPLINFKSIYLRGNHEQILLDFLNIDPSIAVHWFQYGGQATFLSYGVSVSGIPVGEKIKQLQIDLAEKIPESHLSFFNQLEYSYSCGDYFFVHAGVRPKVSLNQQNQYDKMWIRDEFLSSKFKFEKMIVHGHTIVEKPEQRSNRIAIDTGAYFSGCLTSLVLEGQEQRFIQTDSKNLENKF